MKIEQSTVEVQSNMQFDESVEMGIGHDAIPMVIERLIEAYNHPERAVLREYSSNAYDVHVEQGITRPVEVTLPGPLAPNLIFRDFGVGLSRQELKGFGQFGVSTKRATNELTGGFGLGSKSALAVASQFIVTSIKDGKRNTVVVARDEQNRPHMNFLAETETEEDSGTTITVPMSSAGRLGSLDTFFVGWKPGSILVDDEKPKVSVYDPDQFRELPGGVGWKDLRGVTSGRDVVRVLINQVYYELEYQKIGLSYGEWGNLKSYIIKVDNGSVKIAPSREDLIYNTPTRETLMSRMNDVLRVARVDYELAIEAAPSVKQALQAIDTMRNAGYPADDVKYKGQRILLPGTEFKGNRIPNPEGTWCSPMHVGSTKTGWMVEKRMQRLRQASPWSFGDNRKFVIVHSADPAVRHYTGSGRSRFAHKEFAYVGDWLSSITDAQDSSWEVFITSEKLSRVNKWYREMADVLLSAEDFTKVALDARAARVKREAQAKSLDTRLVVMIDSRDGSPVLRKYSVEEIKNNYDKAIILRNMSGGMDQTIRDSLMTKTNYHRQYSNFATRILRLESVAFIMVNKNDDLTDLIPLLPPITTFGQIAAERVRGSIKTPTKYERMALRDRINHSVSAISSMKDDQIAKITNKKTRKWLTALRDFKDNGQQIRDSLEWLRPYYPEVKAAFDEVAGKTKAKKADESFVKRYPLLEVLDSYRLRDHHVVSYVNLVDASIED
ncbi:rIIA-like protein [Microbacterium phage Zooman]|nr:rIIA-like protein [Microbacterium phage Zooman]